MYFNPEQENLKNPSSNNQQFSRQNENFDNDENTDETRNKSKHKDMEHMCNFCMYHHPMMGCSYKHPYTMPESAIGPTHMNVDPCEEDPMMGEQYWDDDPPFDPFFRRRFFHRRRFPIHHFHHHFFHHRF